MKSANYLQVLRLTGHRPNKDISFYVTLITLMLSANNVSGRNLPPSPNDNPEPAQLLFRQQKSRLEVNRSELHLNTRSDGANTYPNYYEGSTKNNSPPEFSQNRYGKGEVIDVAVFASLQLELKCKATGQPEPEITWLKNGRRISTETPRRFHGYKLKKWTLSMADANPRDAGNYTCLAENESGSVQQDFAVKVESRIAAHKPIIKNGFPGNHSVLVGKDVELKCEIELLDIANPPMIQWLYHPEINGSMFSRDKDTPNTIVLQDCTMTGQCTISDSDETYVVDDAQVGWLLSFLGVGGKKNTYFLRFLLDF